MKSSLRTRSNRGIAAGALSVALLTSAAATAFAAGPVAPSPSPSMSMMMPPSPTATKSGTPTRKPAVTAASITIRANRTDVKSGHSVTFTGRTTGLKVGNRLDLQRFDGRKWVTVKTVTVKRGSNYTLVMKLSGMGKEMLRVVHGKTMSPTVTITVR